MSWNPLARVGWVVVGAAMGCVGGAALGGDLTPSFTAIPGRPGDNPFASHALGVSGDGSVVFGEVRTVGRWEGMTWTREGGTVAHPAGTIFGASFDGSVLAGNGGRWTSGTGWVQLPRPAGATGRTAGGISDDGTTIVGTAVSGQNHNEPVRWRGPGAAEYLPRPPISVDHSAYAHLASWDGNFVAGNADNRAWVTDGASAWFPHTNAGLVYDLTPDARYIVGYDGGATNAGYRMDLVSGEFVFLPNRPGSQGGRAMGITADGSVVVGAAGTTSRAYMWDAAHGTRDLAGVLSGMGVDLGGWVLTEARGISNDGTVIVGLGVNPAVGLEQSWVAVIPGPGAAGVVVVFGCVGMVRRGRR